MVLAAGIRAAAPRAAQAAPARVTVGARCYAVGAKVKVAGSGFAAASPYDISVDGIDFGQSLTSPTGTFAAAFAPGGLGAGQAQLAELLTASDGTTTATVAYTVTRRTGALFVPGTGSSPRRAVPFQVWDFAPTGAEVPVYLHYVAPNGTSTHSVKLGTTTGQCGALSTAKRALFPFDPGTGTWTLQFDTSSRYSATPGARVARLRILIS
jgi:hypothetical protein